MASAVFIFAVPFTYMGCGQTRRLPPWPREFGSLNSKVTGMERHEPEIPEFIAERDPEPDVPEDWSGRQGRQQP